MGIYIQYIYITNIVVLVSEPVRGRSRATELPCYTCIPIFLGRRGTPDPTGQLVKVIFNVRKVQFGLLLSIWIGQYLRNGACCDQCLYEAHIQSHIWYFSWPCDLWPWTTFKGQIKVTDFQGVVSHKWCIIWSKFVWNTYSKSYMAFQFTL